jgi:integrase
MAKTPSYRQRRGYSNALVTLTDSETGTRRDYWLGEHGTAHSREAYHRVIATWESNGRRLPEVGNPAAAPPPPGRSAAGRRRRAAKAGDVDDLDGAGPTVKQIILRYWAWAKTYYRPAEVGTLRSVLRLLRDHYGSTPAASFGPNSLRLLRDAMARGDASSTPPRSPLARKTINGRCRRIRHVFKWAAAHELIPASIYDALATIEPLKRGRCDARETEPVQPVARELVDATLKHLPRQVAAIVRLQLWTGARPGELLRMRAVDIDTSDKSGVWIYKPVEHKNMYRGKDRVILLGPQCQAVITEFIASRATDAFLFSPAEAEAERRAELTRQRRTPRGYGNSVGTNRSDMPEREPGDHYTTPSYARAITRACDAAFPPPEHLRRQRVKGSRGTRMETEQELLARLTEPEREELKRWRDEHRWHPHQLRHTAATDIRREFGLEHAQVMLGHSSAEITEAVYAERDLQKAMEVARRVG